MKYKLLIIAVTVAALVYLLFSIFFVDVQINKYSDIQAVKDQKAMQHGWIPEILPPSAYEITETHNIDTNELFGSFKYKEEDKENFISNLTTLNDKHHTFVNGNFLFRLEEKTNYVKFRNKPTTKLKN